MNVIELGNKISETTIPKTHVKSTRKQAYLTVKWFTIKKLTHAHKPTCKYAKNSLIPSTITRQCFESHSPYEEPHRESRTFTRWDWVNTHKHTHSPDVLWGVDFHLCASFCWTGLKGVQRRLIKTSPPTARDSSVERTASSIQSIMFGLKLRLFHGS